MKSIVLICLTDIVVGAHTLMNTGCGDQTVPTHPIPSSTYGVGRESIPHSWPWRVILRYRTSTLTSGGVLIRNNDGQLVVLTAADCVDGTDNKPGDWTIDTEVHSRSANEQNQRSYYVKSINSHNQYSSRTFDNDIAIMKLSQTVIENDDVSPICVTSVPSRDYWYQLCVVTGWVTTSEVGSTSDRLQEVYKPVLTDAECTSYFGTAYNPRTMLCAGAAAGGHDFCQEDSGGPFACMNSYGFWDLMGISSWGYGCAGQSLPSVYADVYNYLTWISNNA